MKQAKHLNKVYFNLTFKFHSYVPTQRTTRKDTHDKDHANVQSKV